jgi:hypothetical protein
MVDTIVTPDETVTVQPMAHIPVAGLEKVWGEVWTQKLSGDR